MDKYLARYKRNVDARVTRNIPPIKTDDYLFFRKDYYSPQKKKRHKLFPIAHGPYRVVSMDDSGSTVVPGIKGEHGRISRDRVVLEPKTFLDVTTPPNYLGKPPTQRVTPHSTAGISMPPILSTPTRGLDDLPGASVSLSAVTRLTPPPYILAPVPAAKEGEGSPVGNGHSCAQHGIAG